MEKKGSQKPATTSQKASQKPAKPARPNQKARQPGANQATNQTQLEARSQPNPARSQPKSQPGFPLRGLALQKQRQLRGILPNRISSTQRLRFQILRRTRLFPGWTSARSLSGRIESFWETPSKERGAMFYVRAFARRSQLSLQSLRIIDPMLRYRCFKTIQICHPAAPPGRWLRCRAGGAAGWRLLCQAAGAAGWRLLCQAGGAAGWRRDCFNMSDSRL